MMSPLGFETRVGSALFTCFAEVNVMYIPSDLTSGSTPADLLTASIAASHCLSVSLFPL